MVAATRRAAWVRFRIGVSIEMREAGTAPVLPTFKTPHESMLRNRLTRNLIQPGFLGRIMLHRGHSYGRVGAVPWEGIIA